MLLQSCLELPKKSQQALDMHSVEKAGLCSIFIKLKIFSLRSYFGVISQHTLFSSLEYGPRVD